MNVIIIFPGGVGLPPSMDTRRKQLEMHLKWWLFNFNQTLSDIFMFNDAAVLIIYKHADRQTDRLTDRLTDRQTGRLAGWLTGWLADWLTDWQTDRQTDRNMDYGGMFFLFSLPVRRSQGTSGTRDSECRNLRRLKDSGTKIVSFQCEGHRREWRFPKHQSSDDLPEAVLTVDSHCQYTCKVCAQCQSLISCGAELLPSRHSICVSQLSKHL